MSKKLKVQTNIGSDEFQTPKEAIEFLLPYLKKTWIILDCAYGGGKLAEHFRERGFNVVGSKNINFLSDSYQSFPNFDCVVTNPPYSYKEEFLIQLYTLGKPFALLMPLTALEGKKRGELYRKYGIQLIIPDKIINFITPSGKGSGAWFQVAWYCYKLNLPNQLNFVEAR